MKSQPALLRGNDYLTQTLFVLKDGKFYGRIWVKYLGNNQVSIYPDTYNFDLNFSNPMKLNEFFSPRNFFTALGNIFAGNGKSFTINFYAVNTIKNGYKPNFESLRGPKL